MFRKSLTILLLAALMASATYAQTVKSRTDADPAEPEFEQLFNGKDLAGWDGDPAFWSVKDGTIVAKVQEGLDVKNHSYLIWQGGRLKDFQLSLLVRSTQGNSGIDYRAMPVTSDKDVLELKWTIKGYQCDIAQGWMGSLYNWGRPGAQPSHFILRGYRHYSLSEIVGSVVDKDALLKAGYYRPNQWNRFTIIARGSHILHRINGYLVVEFINNTNERRNEGLLGLQVHSGARPFHNEFKDIRLKKFNTKFGLARLLFNDGPRTYSTLKTGVNWHFDFDKNTLAYKGKFLNGIFMKQRHVCTNYILRFQYLSRAWNKSEVILRLCTGQKEPPRGIRIHGDGDDFNRISPFGDFELKVRKLPKDIPFRRMPDGFWNECEIVLNRSRLEVKVNGRLRVAATDCQQTSGGLGFQVYGPVKFRNVVLIPIIEDN